jgi:ribosome-associated protein
MKETPDPTLDLYVKAALGKKASDLVLLDVRKQTSIADAFLICSGHSNRQVTAIAEHIKKTLKEQGIHPLSIDGLKEGHWVLLDYGDVIIHVFYESVRAFYDLEGLWVDAKRIKTASLVDFEATSSKETVDEEIIIE